MLILRKSLITGTDLIFVWFGNSYLATRGSKLSAQVGTGQVMNALTDFGGLRGGVNPESELE